MEPWILENGVPSGEIGTFPTYSSLVRTQPFLSFPYVMYNKENLKGRKQTNMEGGQSSTYLRLKRALSGPQVSVAKTYRDETKLK